MPSEVQTKKGEPIDKALRRLKKKLDREGVLRELRNRRHYEKPSEIKRREEKRLVKRIAKESRGH
ncbi:MAG: 30S ribosomal protein S21 [Lentisphaeraceae bacterium]|nr:30S ribosomal protein S21 [Lentisphaeraceae bacterium]